MCGTIDAFVVGENETTPTTKHGRTHAIIRQTGNVGW